MIAFLGTSHAAKHLRDAAILKGVAVAEDWSLADVLFVSEDTPTDEHGNRDLGPVRDYLEIATTYGVPIVLTSQVPPGFTRSLGLQNIYHLAETLRIKDAMERALNPEQFIVGVSDPAKDILPQALTDYFSVHLHARGNVLVMSYEDAEFAKIAINMFLAAQVDATNRLAVAAAKVGAKWERVKWALEYDKRIGPHAYLTPGRWQDSRHLLRDHVTLEGILAR